MKKTEKKGKKGKYKVKLSHRNKKEKTVDGITITQEWKKVKEKTNEMELLEKKGEIIIEEVEDPEAAGKLKFIIEIDDKGNAVIKDTQGNIKKLSTETTDATDKMSKGFAGMWKQMALGQAAYNTVMIENTAIGRSFDFECISAMQKAFYNDRILAAHNSLSAVYRETAAIESLSAVYRETAAIESLSAPYRGAFNEMLAELKRTVDVASLSASFERIRAASEGIVNIDKISLYFEGIQAALKGDFDIYEISAGKTLAAEIQNMPKHTAAAIQKIPELKNATFESYGTLDSITYLDWIKELANSLNELLEKLESLVDFEVKQKKPDEGHEKLKIENKELKEENKELKEENKELKEGIKELKEGIKALPKTFDKLSNRLYEKIDEKIKEVMTIIKNKSGTPTVEKKNEKILWLGSINQLKYLINWLKEKNVFPEKFDYWKWAYNYFLDENGESFENDFLANANKDFKNNKGNNELRWFGSNVQLAYLIKWLANRCEKDEDSPESNLIPLESDYWKWAGNCFLKKDGNKFGINVLAQAYNGYSKAKYRNYKNKIHSKGVKEMIIFVEKLAEIK